MLVEIDSGRVLGPLPAPAGALPVSEVVSAVPEIFGAQALLKHRLLGEMAVLSELLDLVLISPTRVHVLQRVPAEPARALVSVAGRENSVGWVVSEARSRLERT